MTNLTAKESVTEFARLLEPFIQFPEKPSVVFEVLFDFYRNVRISGTKVENDDDMLLLASGYLKPLLMSGFTDFRKIKDKNIKYDTDKYLYVGLERQIFPSENEDSEFDDAAFGLFCEFIYEKSERKEEIKSLWIHQPSEINGKLQNFLEIQLAKRLYDIKPLRINAYLSYVG